MDFKERVYSVLVVSAAEKLNTALLSLLPDSRYAPVKVESSVSAAKRAWSKQAFDLVIVNSPLPDDVGTGFAIDTGKARGTAVLFLARAELHADLHDRLAGHGVFTLPKPTSRPMLALALGWMASTREKLRLLEKKTLSVEEKMEEIRTVNRAKWLLISALRMDEPQAHRYIEKQAMDRCISRREVAEELIRTYS